MATCILQSFSQCSAFRIIFAGKFLVGVVEIFVFSHLSTVLLLLLYSYFVAISILLLLLLLLGFQIFFFSCLSVQLL